MTDLAERLAACRIIDRNLDARIAVALYSDTGHPDSRDNTYARTPAKSDECAPGTYWISSFSGLSLRTAPMFSSDPLLKRIAIAALSQPDAAEMRAEIVALREAIGRIVDARDDENFDALIEAIAEAEAEVVVRAMEGTAHEGK